MSHSLAADETRTDTRDTASCAPGLLWPMLFPYRVPAPRREQSLPQHTRPGNAGQSYAGSGHESRRQDAQLRAKSP